MKSLCKLFSVVLFALSGCSGTPQSNLYSASGSVGPSLRSQRPVSLSYAVLYQFTGGPDGRTPRGGLIDVDGTLYGTTAGNFTTHFGGVFALTTGGKETSLYNFAGGRDGNHPRAALTYRNGVLYGTTEDGGSGYGTVFSVTTDGAEKVLHRFGGRSDGELPLGALLDLKGALYGTTSDFGSTNHGTVFQITSKSRFVVLDVFGGSDGSNPVAGLIDEHGVLYGTTASGGASRRGTIFRITFAGVKTLHSFVGGSDGSTPYSDLTDVGGTLYGTTRNGGSGAGCAGGCGTVFKMKTDGTGYDVLYSFAGGNDGAGPVAGLLDVNGTLYGTTEQGGAQGRGTVFAIDLSSGVEQVVHSFAGGTDGASPEAGLIEVGDALYGTTANGGARHFGIVYTLSGI
jgi:uncharacterized repeat protein (TIGR03803 family)